MAFATFSVTYNLPQNRLQLSFTLLLTAVTFKWVVVRCLPTISYLTTLVKHKIEIFFSFFRLSDLRFQDKYVLLSMFMLCVVCAWHAIIAMCPSDVAPYWDHLALITLAVIYTLFHLVFFLWMYFVVSTIIMKIHVQCQLIIWLDLPTSSHHET